RLNDSMGEYVASQVVKTMIKKNIKVNGAKVLNLGITFKENCPDVRNTKAVDVIRGLEDYSIAVTTYDPWANPAEVMHEYGIKSCQNINECFSGTEALEVQPFDAITQSPSHPVTQSPSHQFDAIILTVAHKEFLDLDLSQYLKEGGVVYDVKGILEQADSRLYKIIMKSIMKITLIAGARPNFMKIAPVIHAIQKAQLEGKKTEYRLVHTGQHY